MTQRKKDYVLLSLVCAEACPGELHPVAVSTETVISYSLYGVRPSITTVRLLGGKSACCSMKLSSDMLTSTAERGPFDWEANHSTIIDVAPIARTVTIGAGVTANQRQARKQFTYQSPDL